MFWKKKVEYVKCFACGGTTTAECLTEHYTLCYKMHVLQGLAKGLSNGTSGQSPNAVRAALGFPKEHTSGSAIDEPIHMPDGYMSANAENPCLYCAATSFRRHHEECPFYMKHDQEGHWISTSGPSSKSNDIDEWLKSASERLDRERKAKSWKPPLESDLVMRCVSCHHPDPKHSSKCSQPGLLYNPGTNEEHQYSTEEVRQTSSTGGQKGTKPEAYSLVPTEPIAALARLMKKGAVKYEAHNWRRGYPASDSYDALTRHLHAWWSGENNDPEMQESHLAAVMFHCCVLMELIEKHPEFDDRYILVKEKVGDLTEEENKRIQAIYDRNLAWLAHQNG